MLAGTDPPASMEQRRRRPDRVIALLESATSASDAWNCDGDIGGVSLRARVLSSPLGLATRRGRDRSRTGSRSSASAPTAGSSRSRASASRTACS